MVSVQIDRRVLYVLLALFGLAVPLGIGLWLGQSGNPPQTTTPSGTPDVSVVGLPPGQAAPEVSLASPVPDMTLAAIPRITVEEAYAKFGQPNVIFVDARVPDQYGQGHIQGAISVPEVEVAGRLSDLPKDKELILYCA